MSRKGKPMPNSVEARRQAVLSKYRVEDRGYTSPCWVYEKKGNYYAYATVAGSAEVAHRIFYKHHVGDIPEGLELDHLCRIMSCVNPAHLEPVTHKENVIRGLPFRGKGLGLDCGRTAIAQIRFNENDRALIAEAKALSSMKTTAEVVREGLKLFVRRLRKVSKVVP